MAKRINVIGILIILVGAFLFLDGIDTLTGNTRGIGGLSHDLSRMFGGSGNTVNIIFAIIEAASGALLIISRFISIGALEGFLRIAVFLFWIMLMVFTLILNGNIEAIDTLAWWSSLVNHSIILVILWMIKG